MDMEKQVELLTNELVKKCVGQGAGVVIGAGLNIVMTAAQKIPDKNIMIGIIMAFRNMADQLEDMHFKAKQ